jgi:TetR/AcrR family transcriptional repressor of lmrAB and yxaGH operons
MTPRGESKKRALRTAAELFRRQGYNGTGLNQIVAESGAPKGSLYFHFPGGKSELAVEAVTASGRAVGNAIGRVLESTDDAAEAIGRVIDFIAADLRHSDYQHGCPVGSVAVDVASTSEPIRTACREIFDEWQATIARRLEKSGWDEQAASDDALVVVSLLEGALVLARSRRDTAPFDAVARHVRVTLTARRRSGPDERSQDPVH